MNTFLFILSVFVGNQVRFCIANHSVIENILNGIQSKDSLTVFAAQFEPYVYIKNDEVYDGIEYHLVKMIGEALNKEIYFQVGNVTDMQNAFDNTK